MMPPKGKAADKGKAAEKGGAKGKGKGKAEDKEEKGGKVNSQFINVRHILVQTPIATMRGRN